MERPGVRIEFDPTTTPMKAEPESLIENALALTQMWLDSLGHAPTAEEVLTFAESYDSVRMIVGVGPPEGWVLGRDPHADAIEGPRS